MSVNSSSKVLGIGTDLVDIQRLKSLIGRRPKIVERVFSKSEQEYSNQHQDPTQRLAVRFAAKEAVMKAMGLGFGAVNMKDIEVVKAKSGMPSVQLSGRAKEASQKMGITHWHLSLSHTDTGAIAVALAEQHA